MAAAEPKLRWAANAARQLGVWLPPGKIRSPPPDLGREHRASVDVLVPRHFGRRVHCGGGVNSTVRRVAWRRCNGLVVRGDMDNGFVAEPAVTLSGGAAVLSTCTFLDICPLATATLSAKVGHVVRASVGERASILLSHPLPIQPNCVDGAGVCRGSSFPMAIDWRRGAGAVAMRRRFSLVVAAERVGVQFLGETNFGRKLCLRAGNNDACGCRFFLLGCCRFSCLSQLLSSGENLVLALRDRRQRHFWCRTLLEGVVSKTFSFAHAVGFVVDARCGCIFFFCLWSSRTIDCIFLLLYQYMKLALSCVARFKNNSLEFK